MDKDRITIIVRFIKDNKEMDIDVPIGITANEFMVGLNQGLNLGMDITDISKCYLHAENPIVLLKGNRTLEEYELRNGTVINL